MQIQSNDFIAVSEIAISDEQLQAAVRLGTSTAFNRRKVAMFAHSREHGEALRGQAAAAKRRAIAKLPELLEQAESQMQANGIQVLWAQTAEEVCTQVLEIAAQHGVKLVAKSKSMVSEEVGLNHALEEAGLTPIETDLGEYIIQLAHEPPSHIIAPVIHKTKAAIRDLFMRELDMPPTDSAQEIAHFARLKLRDVFLGADMGVSGGNFIIAETGTLAIVSNEGNARLCTSLPRVHVAIVGIEKIVENLEDYATLIQVLPRSATGQNLAVYTSLINSPRQADDPDGPEHVYVILVDNGRSKIYETDYAEVLTCIRCGACMNACPVYHATGGHAYGWVYPGPIGAVLTPLLQGIENAKPLPHASSLCGTCKEVCPVDIDLPRMLLDLRHDLTEAGENAPIWNLGIKGWAMTMQSPFLFNLGGKFARFGLKTPLKKRLPGPLGNWTKYRDFPDFAPQSFHELWAEREKNQRNNQEEA